MDDLTEQLVFGVGEMPPGARRLTEREIQALKDGGLTPRAFTLGDKSPTNGGDGMTD
jgi:hypothetical protein